MPTWETDPSDPMSDDVDAVLDEGQEEALDLEDLDADELDDDDDEI